MTVRIADSTDEPRTTLVPGSPKLLLQTWPRLSSLRGCTTLCIPNRAYWRALRDCCHKPMTLIMPKQKAVFFFTVAAQQQQVSVTPLNIQHYEFSCRCRAAEYQKVFSSGIST